jgi:hypothetical protein
MKKPVDNEGNEGKNVHAVALGRLGGLKGGVARAQVLSPERRSEIARKAIKERWHPNRIRIASDRGYRMTVAARLARSSNLDAGDIEHALYNLTLLPLERIVRCLLPR